jgi:hypothetical protein
LTCVENLDPDKIVLLDGVFDQDIAVWHREILYALDKGVIVIGGASMGALRATELDEFGMVGVGKIYEQFASGREKRDDFVAITHGCAEAKFKPLTISRADIYFWTLDDDS